MKEQLLSLMQASGVDLSAKAVDGLVAYQEIVLKANGTQNLTALRSPEVFLREGILDSLLAWRVISVTSRDVLDVGSGSGLPGLVWCIAGFAQRAVLVEAERRKGEFLAAAAKELGLDVEIRWGRAEEEARGGLRDRAGLVTARALASAPVAVEVCGGLVRPGGVLCLLKGEPGRTAREAALAAPVAARMGFAHAETRSYSLDSAIERTLLVYRKLHPTPAGRPTSFARLRREFPSGKAVAEREGGAEGE